MKTYDKEIFIANFEDFCKTPGVDSGKAHSYAKAIEYLCDYLGITTIDANAIVRIKGIQDDLTNPESAFYKDLLSFLEERNQSSYLSKGFIRSALKYFFDFYDEQN